MPFSKNAIRISDNFLGDLDRTWDAPVLQLDPMGRLAYIQFREQV